MLTTLPEPGGAIPLSSVSAARITGTVLFIGIWSLRMRAASQRVVLVVGPSLPWPTEPSAKLEPVDDGSGSSSSSIFSSSGSSVREVQHWGQPSAGVGCRRWGVATELACSSSSSNFHSNNPTSSCTSTSNTPANSALRALHSAFASVTLSSLSPGLLPPRSGDALPLHQNNDTLPHNQHSQEALSHGHSHSLSHSAPLTRDTCQSQQPQLLFSLAEAPPSRGGRGAAAAAVAGGGGLEDDLSRSGLLPPGEDLERMLQGALMGAGEEEYGEPDSEQQEAELARWVTAEW